MNQNAHLILSVDYELFGDGSGCVDKCILQPADRMLRIAERFGAPLTFFAEALEFMALAEKLDYHHSQKQLSGLLARGHDVQLHLHPQWADANYISKRGWELNLSRWRIGDLSAEHAAELICLGKQWLEAEIAANVPGYHCCVFRAGGWCIQPSQFVVEALMAQGFLADSTVAPGQWRSGRGEWSDFRKVPELPFWRTEGDVCKPSQIGLLEIPIAGGVVGKGQHLKSLLTVHRSAEQGIAPGCVGSYRGPASSIGSRLLAKSARIAQLGKVMLDISTLPAALLIKVTQQWLNRYGLSNACVPVVAIAHTKNFTAASEDAMLQYLNWAKDNGLIFSTYGKWLNEVKGKIGGM